MKPTLFVLAAGMGSRYGGLKQLDGLGPNGETIMDYSIYDAIRGGFGRVVFVIRKDFDREFREKILSKYEDKIPVEVVYQSVDKLPFGYACPEGRTKPWGTVQAVLMAKGVIMEPFAVINADDFYGRASFDIIGRWLSKAEGRRQYCMVGYHVGNTLSESGTVSRGICEKDENRMLKNVVESKTIEPKDGKIIYTDEAGVHELAPETPVSMNMWGFTPDYFAISEREFCKFLDRELNSEKGECVIPDVISPLIDRGEVSVKVLDTHAVWFGVTYAADRQGVVDKLKALTEKGEYPSPLF